MKEEDFNYDVYCNRSNERMASLEMLRGINHPLFGEYVMLINRQKAYLKLMESHIATAVLLREDNIGMRVNSKMMESIASRIAQTDLKMNSLYTRMTRKMVDRKAYWKKYYNEHRREIAARHRLYDRSKYKQSQEQKDALEQYRYQHKDRTLLLGRMGRFFSFDNKSTTDYYVNLKRAAQQVMSNTMMEVEETIKTKEQ